MSYILTIDSATDNFSVGLVREGAETAEIFCRKPRTQLMNMAPSLNFMYSMYGISFRDTELIAVTSGPGSFTGLRLALTTAKTIAQTEGIPVCGVNTIDAVAAGLPPSSQTAAVILDARRGELFTAFYRLQPFQRLGGYRAVTPEVFIREAPEGEMLITGNGLERYGSMMEKHLPEARLLPRAFWYPRACGIAALAQNIGGTADYESLEPFYMRKAEAEETWERKQQCRNSETTA